MTGREIRNVAVLDQIEADLDVRGGGRPPLRRGKGPASATAGCPRPAPYPIVRGGGDPYSPRGAADSTHPRRVPHRVAEDLGWRHVFAVGAVWWGVIYLGGHLGGVW